MARILRFSRWLGGCPRDSNPLAQQVQTQVMSALRIFTVATPKWIIIDLTKATGKTDKRRPYPRSGQGKVATVCTKTYKSGRLYTAIISKQSCIWYTADEETDI